MSDSRDRALIGAALAVALHELTTVLHHLAKTLDRLADALESPKEKE